MLGKLLKYELKGNVRILLPFYGLILALSLINRLFTGNWIYSTQTPTATMNIAAIAAFAYGLTFMAVMLLTVFLVIQRFAKTVYGDEGYLTNTLPVTSSEIIISKTISAFLWMGLSGLVALLSIFIIAFEPGMIDAMRKMYVFVVRLLGDQVSLIAFKMIMYFIFMSVAGSISAILMVYMSISIGQLFSRKLLGSIGAFLGVNVILNIVSGFLANIYANFQIPYFGFESMIQYMDQMGIFVILYSLVQIGIFYYVTNYIMKNKLNLE